jgi:hypothetical protein
MSYSSGGLVAGLERYDFDFLESLKNQWSMFGSELAPNFF